MPIFITETSQEKPIILVTGEQSELFELLKTTGESKGFEVSFVSPNKLESYSSDAREVFRVVWMVANPSAETELQRVSTWLQSRQEHLVILSWFETPFSTQNAYLHQLEKNRHFQQTQLEELKKRHPHAMIYLAQDLVSSQTQGLSWVGECLIFPSGKGRDEGFFLDPELTFYPQTPAHFWQHIQSRFFHPKARQEIIRGRERTSTEFLEILQQLYAAEFQIKFPLRKEPVKAEKVAAAKTVETHDSRVDFTPVLRTVLSKLKAPPPAVVLPPLVAAEAPQITTLITPPTQGRRSPQATHQPPTSSVKKNVNVARSVRVTPVPVPVIENRLRKYEEKKAQIARRRQVSQYLRPSLGQHVPVLSNHTTKTQASDQEKKLAQEVSRVFGQGRVVEKVQRVQQKVETTLHIEQKNTRRSWVLLGLAIGLGVAVGLGSLMGLFIWSKNQLVAQLTAAQTSAVDQKQMTVITTAQLSQVSRFLAAQIQLYQLFRGKDAFPESTLLVSLATETSEVMALNIEVQDLVEQAFAGFWMQRVGEVLPKLEVITGKTQEMYKKLSLLQAYLKSPAASDLSNNSLNSLTKFNQALQEKRKVMALGDQFQPILASLLAKQGKKTYALVLQNSQELRSTGGYIQAVALLTIENGALIDSQIFDVNTLDKNVQGLVTPPVEVQRYLGQKQWLLRDANWSPDFPTTAQQVSWFLEKSTGRKVDGVIAINLYTIQKLLRSLGVLEISEYNEVLNDRNLFDRVEFHSEARFVDSAQQDYLALLLQKLFQRFSTLPADKTTAVLSAWYEAFREGQAFAWFPDQNLTGVMRSVGWGGELSTPQCPAQFTNVPCTVDTMMQVEANIGVNKANYSLERSIFHTIRVVENQVAHERVITFKNNATSTAWPMGAYKSYIRFYVPEQAQLQSVFINDEQVGQNSLVEKTEQGKKYFGVLVEVPVQKQLALKISYSLPVTTDKAFSYAFFDQKQAGTGEDPYLLTVLPEIPLSPSVVAPEPELKNGGLIFNMVRDKHLFVGVQFGK